MLGGGPAGLATAIELRQASDLDVVVVEARVAPSERYGESVPPDILVALDRLGVSGAFRADGHLPCPGSVSLWGSDRPGHNDFILSPLGPAWHISRSRFEAMLRARAEQSGAVLWTGSRAVEVAPIRERFDATIQRTKASPPPDDGFDVTIQRAGGDREVVHASWVVDATGWRAWFARRQGAVRCEVERMVAIVRFATVRSGAFTAQTVVEATPDGWWYCARLPDDQITTVFLTAPQDARSLLADDHAGWRERLAETHLLAPRLADCVVGDERVRAYPAPSGILDRVRGERWFAVGDAAAAYDPIASRGIHTALADARDAAATILSATGNAVVPARNYEQQVEARFQDYRANRSHLYAQEQRWGDRPFWQALAAQASGRAVQAVAPEALKVASPLLAVGDAPLDGLAETGQPRVVVADDLGEEFVDRVEVDGFGRYDGFDVGPVLRAVERGLEHDEFDGAEHGDLAAREWLGTRVPSGPLVDRKVVEEDVDRGVLPPEARLAVAQDEFDRSGRRADLRGKRGERRLAILLANEHVDVEISRTARFERVLRQGDRAAERVGNAGGAQRARDREQLLGERNRQAQAAARGPPTMSRSGGSLSCRAWRAGSASASSITCARICPRRSRSLSDSERTAERAGWTSSRAPLAARSRANVSADGVLRPAS